jgi:putative Mn2+ efflux pump MntP
MIKSKIRSRDDLWNTAIMTIIAAGLAFWAYHTVAHAVLFGFVAFVVVAMGNRLSGELHQWRSKIEANQLMDKLGM